MIVGRTIIPWSGHCKHQPGCRREAEEQPQYDHCDQVREEVRAICDLDDPTDRAILKNWCNKHWDSLIKRAIDSQDPLYFHECCFSFSKRGFTDRHSHPNDSTFSILRMYDIKQCRSPEDLQLWIAEKLETRAKRALPTFFPCLNSPHMSSTEMQDYRPTKKEQTKCCLGKREPVNSSEVDADDGGRRTA